MGMVLTARARALLLLVLLAVPGAAFAQDAGPPADYVPDKPQTERFATPSGNIWCELSDPYADEPASQSVSCMMYKYSNGGTLDCGPEAIAISLAGNGGVITSCATDLRDCLRAAVLGYGKSVSVGTITCQSEISGLTCQTDQGRGFKLSRTLVRIF